MSKDVLLTDDIILFAKNRILSKNKFINALQIRRRSYLAVTLASLYDLFFNNSISLFSEYKKYYKKEYASYNDFIECRFNLTNSQTNIIANRKYYFKSYAKMPNYYVVNSLLSEEDIRSIFWRRVEKGDEN